MPAQRDMIVSCPRNDGLNVMRSLRFISLLLLLFPGLLTAAPTIELWDGHDLSHWQFVTKPAMDIAKVCHATPDGALACAGRPIGYLLASSKSYTNFKLHVEWRWPGEPGNGGILVFVSSGPKDRQWPLCFQVQLKANRAGDIFAMAGATCAEKPAKSTLIEKIGVNSEKSVGKWNRCDITCHNGTIKCWVNGVYQNEVTKCSPAAGRIGFQFEGTPFELRNLRVTPID